MKFKIIVTSHFKKSRRQKNIQVVKVNILIMKKIKIILYLIKCIKKNHCNTSVVFCQMHLTKSNCVDI